MGRHAAPAPVDAQTAPIRVPARTSDLPVITAAMLRQPPARVSAAAVPAPRRAVATVRPETTSRGAPSAQRLLATALITRPEPGPVTAAFASPVRARAPQDEQIRLAPPELSGPTLSTGPIPTRAIRASRGRRGARIAISLAAIAVAGIVASQVTTLRSEAADAILPFTQAGVTTAATSASPDATVSVPSRASASSSTASASASASATRSATRSTSAPGAHLTSRSPLVVPKSGRSLTAALADSRTLAAGLFEFDDFGSDLLGMDLTGRLVGAGSADTVLQMTPGSSTKASSVPKKAWSTNQLSLIRINGATTVSGFTLRGTDQGHLYNGLRISRSTNPTISDVRVISIPGDDDVPPGETFGINDFRTKGATYSNVEVDGSGISGATFGTNDSSDVTIADSDFHDAGHSNGATFWQTKNVTVRNTTSVNNHDAAFNFERVSGTVVLDHVTMHGNRLSDLRIDSDQSSAVYRIIDPDLGGGKLTIVMTPTYMGHANVQKKSDVHVIVNGVDRTDELVRWVDHF